MCIQIDQPKNSMQFAPPEMIKTMRRSAPGSNKGRQELFRCKPVFCENCSDLALAEYKHVSLCSSCLFDAIKNDDDCVEVAATHINPLRLNSYGR